MKIVIIGFSGSGKSTLAKQLGMYYNLDVLHLDSVHFLPNWVERSTEDMNKDVISFLDTHKNWVIEGNYTKLDNRRFLEADIVIYLAFNRFICLFRVIKRYFNNRNKTRADMAFGCHEKLDLPFLWWVFFKGRYRSRKKKYQAIARNASRGYILRNKRQVKRFLKEIGADVNEVSMQSK